MVRLIHETEYRSYYAITEQADRFIRELEERDWLDFVRRAAVLDLSLATGRPPAGAAERVEGSSTGLWELRVTPNSRRGPKVRFLYVCVGKDIFVVRCVRKREPSLRRHEINLADRDAKGWKDSQQDDQQP